MSNQLQAGDIVSVVDDRDLGWDEALDTNEVYTVSHVTTYMAALEEKPGFAYHYSRFNLEARPWLAEAEHLHEGLNTPYVPLYEMLDRLPADRREAVEARAEELIEEALDEAHEPREFPDAYYTPLPEELDVAFAEAEEARNEALERLMNTPAPWITPEELAEFSLEGIGDNTPSPYSLEAPELAELHIENEALKASDAVRQPHHYARYVIEPATFIAANKLPFDVGNVVKYVLRYDAKNGREDVLKATRYCEMLLERIDREARVAAGEDASTVWSVML